ncbi:MAG: methionine adenosyltransferase [Candidatus Wukongarchaeota archaeon]|nr:methionine adenosyltransferase [Candidatus Wukongarchaeota archaeon]
MKRNIVLTEKPNCLIQDEKMCEMVERKGKGHPDTITDAAVEEVSKSLCKEYYEFSGKIFHHNVDKAALAGGRSNAVFGGGEVIEPIYILIVGRATTEIIREEKSKKVDVGSIVAEAVEGYIISNLRFLDPKKHLVIDYKIKPGTVDLVSVFETETDIPLANDTSFGCGFAPFSETEQLVYDSEHFLNSQELKKELPEVGEDIKVMGVRMEDNIRLTIATAMISSLIPDLDHYLNVKEEVKEKILNLTHSIAEREVLVDVNTGDQPERGVVYLTVTGTSAEHGDDGQVGRGNRANGLITPYRPQSLEATAGKNPVNHTGKLLNVTANSIAKRIIKECDKISEVNVLILSQIGKPIDEPQLCNVQWIPSDKNLPKASVENDMKSICNEELGKIPKLWKDYMKGKFELF